MTQDSPTERTPLIKQSELLSKLVINRLTAEEVGRVDQIWVDGKQQQAIGMTYRSGLVSLKRPMFSWTQIESIGADSIVVTLPAGAVQDKPPETAVTLIGYELWTEDGSRAGTIGDYHLDSETGQVVDYLVIRDEWQGMTSGIYRLLPTDVITIGSHRVLVPRAAIDSAEQVVGAIAQRVREFFKHDYQRTLHHLSAAVEETRSIAHQLQSKAQTLTEQAQHQLGGASAEPEEPKALPENESHTLPPDGSIDSDHPSEPQP